MRICSSCASVLAADAACCPTDGGSPRTVEQLPAGARLGAYRIGRQLGEGGMGYVYEATHEMLGRRAALKLLRAEFTANPGVITRFLQEAKAVNLINHDHIVDVYDYGDSRDGAVYFVMEYLEGETLGDLLDRCGRFDLAMLVHLFTQIMRALAAAHAKQIVHRDLKPANVFVIKREQNPYFAKLLDFGVAKLIGDAAVPGLTNAGALIGTPQFMSPEQIEGKPVDARTDVWALGVMIYRAVVGQIPWSGKNFGELAGKVLKDAPPAPPAGVTVLPEVDRMIRRALAKDARDRYQSVADMLADLEAIRATHGVEPIEAAHEVQRSAIPRAAAPPTAGLGQSLPAYQGGQSPRPSRRARLGLVIAAGIAAIGAVAAIALLRGGGEPGEPATAAAAAPPAVGPHDRATAEPDAPDVAAELIAQLGSDNPADREPVMAALGHAATANAAPILYRALDGPPQQRVRAAAILGRLHLPEAAPKIRAALADSGARVRADLAAPLLQLGDEEAIAILEEALADPGQAVNAAAALVEAGRGDRARPVLERALADTPPGRERWRLAAGALARLGDSGARDQLRAELASPYADRSVAAAEVLALAGDAEGLGYLTRVVRDPAFKARPAAAAALARAGDPAALAFVADGLASPEPPVRAVAIGAAARLAASGGREHAGAIAALAKDDPDPTVRATARVGLLAMVTAGER